MMHPLSTLRSVLFLMLVAGISLGLPSIANAAPITYDFTGEVISTLIPGLPTAVTGSFTFEDSTIDSDPSLTVGNYVGAITAFSVDFGGYTFVSTGAADIKVSGGSVDFGPVLNLSGSYNGFSLNYFKIVAVATSGAGDSLSATSAFLSGFALPQPFQGDFYDPSFQAAVGYITAVTPASPDPTPVPEPASGFLLALGLARLAIVRRRQHSESETFLGK